MNLKTCFIGTALALGVSTASYGFTLADSTDVGSLDTFIAATTQSSIGNANPTSESNWVESVLGTQVTVEDKTDPVNLFVTQESSTVVAFALTSHPDYYIVKDSTNFMLFDNQINMDWGVLDLAQYFGVNKLDDLTFSHVTEFNGNMVPVPEPGTSALLAAGILGLYMARRRSSRRSALA